MYSWISLVVFILSFPKIGLGNDILFKSSERQVALIELYSSEGCSSCPPADRWMASLKDNKHLWKKFVPINFHVDYWNRLGWVDRFSNREFSNRQRRYANEWGSPRVYTPGFVKNGREWRERTLSNLLGSKVGVLKVNKTKDNQSLKIEFAPSMGGTGDYQFNIARLGHGLSTSVRYGENAGETLHHEFVVLWQTQGPLKLKSNSYQAEIKTPSKSSVQVPKESLAVWITKKGSQKPIQATGGYL